MKVTIVGAGNMGRGIGTRAVAGGHQVEIVDHDPAEAGKLAEELGGSATALDPGAPFGGELVVFAVYYPGIKEAVRQYADQLSGKVVVDITNPVDTQTWDNLATPRLPPHRRPATTQPRLRQRHQAAPLAARPMLGPAEWEERRPW
jgi:8-hydroxy-5-deazaflavin:NADPH oxidoreductase